MAGYVEVKRLAKPLREFEEEPTLTATELAYFLQFNGFNTQHHVFFAEVAYQSIAPPSDEIARCRWFAPVKIGSLSKSVPTRGIVKLFFRYMADVEHDGLQLMPKQDGRVTP